MKGMLALKKQLLPQNCILDDIFLRISELEKCQKQVRNTLASYPPGKIHISQRKRGRTQHYLRSASTQKCGRYIKHSDSIKLKKYLQKAYDEKVLPLLDTELSLLKPFGEKYRSIINEIPTCFSSFPEDSRLYIEPVTYPNDEYAKLWAAEPFESKTFFDHEPSFFTEKGEAVRSKSELTIANTLARKGIPYKYEFPLRLDKSTIIHPDFTILNVRTQKVYYWEHRGMMDDRDYARHTVRLIKSYEANGYFPGDTLLITEETNASPLGTAEIQRIINKYLL
ncbi:MAG: hypothetical protein Q4B73_10220 [Lachnospiraceae bacterium]|nr:hypothetical protein [Lachnospiraceae bacterium]